MLVISTCDADADWSGESLSIDTDDKMEGTGCLVDTVATPSDATAYNMVYDPTGTWDWSAKKHILFWFKCDRASTAFTNAKVHIYEGANYRRWNLTFSAGVWTAQKKLLATGDSESGTPPNLALINYIYVSVLTKDTTAFYKKIDHVRVIVGSQGMIGDDYFMRL